MESLEWRFSVSGLSKDATLGNVGSDSSSISPTLLMCWRPDLTSPRRTVSIRVVGSICTGRWSHGGSSLVCTDEAGSSGTGYTSKSCNGPGNERDHVFDAMRSRSVFRCQSDSSIHYNVLTIAVLH
jgi:hypothetical protein